MGLRLIYPLYTFIIAEKGWKNMKAEVTLWKVNCRSSWELGFGVCACESHPITIETPIENASELEEYCGIYEALISKNIIVIPLRKEKNLRGENVITEAIHIKLQ